MEIPRILVVDDEESIRYVLRSVLERNGHEVREAGSVEEALLAIEAWEPAVALVDVVLPGRNGIQLLGELQRASHDTQSGRDRQRHDYPSHPHLSWIADCT